jgi:hypothetical protein
MSALDELRDGTVGPDFLALLQRTIMVVAVARNFPAPDGFQRWDAKAVTSAVAEFLASPRTPRRLTDLTTHCQTEDGLKKRLQKTVANFFADTGRRTPVGRLVLRVNEVLEQDSDFTRTGSYWTIAGGTDEPAAIDIDTLTVALSAINVVVPTAWRVGTRKSPEIDAPSVIRLATVVLETAGGAVSAAVIAQVTARRLGLGMAPISLEANALDPPQPSGGSSDGTGEAVLIDIRAHEVLSQLNDTERISIGWAELSTAELGSVLGVSKSTAANIRNRAIAILQDELTDDESGQAIADLVLDLARNWTNSWTKAPDAT